MPLLFFLILIVLIATVGFWKTLAAIIGAVAMIVLFVFLIAAAVIVGGFVALGRMR